MYLYLIEGAGHLDTKTAMGEAIDFNPYVLDFLTKKKIPSSSKIHHYNPQAEDGARRYFEESKELWSTAFGVQKWLKSF